MSLICRYAVLRLIFTPSSLEPIHLQRGTPAPLASHANSNTPSTLILACLPSPPKEYTHYTIPETPPAPRKPNQRNVPLTLLVRTLEVPRIRHVFEPGVAWKALLRSWLERGVQSGEMDKIYLGKPVADGRGEPWVDGKPFPDFHSG
jgi:hypothetical protein